MTPSRIGLRIVLDILLAVSIIEGWWFVALIIGLFGTWNFSLYIEILLAGFAYDALFGMLPGMGVKAYLGTILALIAGVTIVSSKKVLRR